MLSPPRAAGGLCFVGRAAAGAATTAVAVTASASIRRSMTRT
jgi:hypothetical protein